MLAMADNLCWNNTSKFSWRRRRDYNTILIHVVHASYLYICRHD